MKIKLGTKQNWRLKRTFSISNMHCAACAHNIERILKGADGVKEATVNLASGTAVVEFDETVITPKEIVEAVENAGFGCKEIDKTEIFQHSPSDKSLRKRTIFAWSFAIPIFIISTAFGNSPANRIVLALLTLPVLAYSGGTFYKTACKQIKHKQVSMDTLVALSTMVDYLFSLSGVFFPEFWSGSRGVPFYFDASAMIIAFVLLGRTIENRAIYKTGSAIRALMKLTPSTARVIKADGHEEDCPINSIKVGDLIRVRTGESVAVDGIITEGNTSVDESMISGEATPVEKKQGDRVIAGTVNGNGSVVVKAESVGGATVISRIIKTVREAQDSKAPIQRIADKVISVFVPGVMGFSIMTFIVWICVGGMQSIPNAITAAVSVLVIACPCSLGLAVPTAITVGIGKAAKFNVLFRDAAALETICNIDTVVFDKTGTLTVGHPVVMKSHVSTACTEEELGLLIKAEEKSTHPTANAIISHLKGKYPPNAIRKILSYDNIVGKGIVFKFNGKSYWAGNRSMMQDHIDIVSDEFKDLANSASVFYGCENKLLAVFHISDKIRTSSAEAVKNIRSLGIKTVLLSGDSRATTESVAKEINVDEFIWSASPDEKLNKIAELRNNGHKVAMIGDGINDSAALAKADISIAIGEGTDVAINASQVVIMNGELNNIYKTFVLSNGIVKKIKQNLFWAFIYNLVGIPVAAGVLYPIFNIMLSPIVCAAAMALSSVSVVLNSLTIYAKKI